jgi:flagellar biosynthesis protein
MIDKQKKAAALNYRRGIDNAPTLVAKGSGLVADKIIALAKERGIPVHEDRDMMEVLSTLNLYDEIPPDLYKAVAEILAFIYNMSGKV